MISNRTITRISMLLAIGCLSIGSPSPVSADQGGLLLNSGLSQERLATRGETYSGVIALRNTSEQPLSVRTYQTDYLFQSDGSNRYDPPGTVPRSNAPWILLPSRQVTVPANGTFNLNYTVSVPDNPGLRGAYWSIVMIETIEVASQEDNPSRRLKPSLGLRTLTRYGVQIITEVPGGQPAVLEFFSPTLADDHDHLTFSIDIRNKGERWTRPEVRLELFDAQGGRVAQIGHPPIRIFPGTSARFRMAMSPLEPGDYRALVIADGGEELFGIDLAVVVE